MWQRRWGKIANMGGGRDREGETEDRRERGGEEGCGREDGAR